jgi:hypothetical protein
VRGEVCDKTNTRLLRDTRTHLSVAIQCNRVDVICTDNNVIAHSTRRTRTCVRVAEYAPRCRRHNLRTCSHHTMSSNTTTTRNRHRLLRAELWHDQRALGVRRRHTHRLEILLKHLPQLDGLVVGGEQEARLPRDLQWQSNICANNTLDFAVCTNESVITKTSLTVMHKPPQLTLLIFSSISKLFK